MKLIACVAALGVASAAPYYDMSFDDIPEWATQLDEGWTDVSVYVTPNEVYGSDPTWVCQEKANNALHQINQAAYFSGEYLPPKLSKCRPSDDRETVRLIKRECRNRNNCDNEIIGCECEASAEFDRYG